MLTIFRLPAIASRSGEAGGDENGQNLSPSAKNSNNTRLLAENKA